MAWISKKELKKKLTELEKKVSELDPEKVSQRLKTAIEELDQFKVAMLNKATEEVNKATGTLEKVKEGMAGLIEKVADEKTKGLSDDLDKVRKDLQTSDEQLAELTRKVKKFISLTQETTKVALSRISEVIKKTLESIEKKSEEPTESDYPELEQ